MYHQIEEWRPIPGWPYEVSNTGMVRNSSGKIIKTYKQKSGYVNVDLHLNGVKKSFRMHRLVADSFIFNPESKTEVNHIDGNKENNDVSNLEWASHFENMTHAFNNGLGADKASPKRVTRDDGVEYESISAAARAHSTSASNIRAAIIGKSKKAKGHSFRLTALIERGA